MPRGKLNVPKNLFCATCFKHFIALQINQINCRPCLDMIPTPIRDVECVACKKHFIRDRPRKICCSLECSIILYRDIAKDRFLQRKYGIALGDFNRLLDKQNNRCAICKQCPPLIKAKWGFAQTLHVDHCHRTGVVRGLLCVRCNQSIGRFEGQPCLPTVGSRLP